MAKFAGTMALKGTNILEAARLLEAGKLVAIPTETVYGLAANALDAKAVVKIFEAKERPYFDPLIVHLPRFEDVEKYALHVPAMAKKLADFFLPGPLTLILHKKDIIPDIVTAGLPTAGFRVPAHPLTQELLEVLDFPLAAPSANPFGYVSPTTALHVEQQLGSKIDYILDGGPCTVGLESTIISVGESGEVTIHRLGGIPAEEIEAVAGKKVHIQINQSGNPAAPGMLKSHYAPGKKMVIGDPKKLHKAFEGKKIALLSFKDGYADFDFLQREVLSTAGDLAEAARNLFGALRRLDESDADVIIAEPFPEKGLGRAINDRLRRASA